MQLMLVIFVYARQVALLQNRLTKSPEPVAVNGNTVTNVYLPDQQGVSARSCLN